MDRKDKIAKARQAVRQRRDEAAQRGEDELQVMLAAIHQEALEIHQEAVRNISCDCHLCDVQ